MDEYIKMLKEKIDALEMWIVLLAILLVVSLGWNYFNFKEIRHNTEYISELQDAVGTSHHVTFSYSE
jgi:hypothetical protein